jgi:hypothetical protein
MSVLTIPQFRESLEGFLVFYIPFKKPGMWRPRGAGGAQPPSFENFRFFPAKICIFI